MIRSIGSFGILVLMVVLMAFCEYHLVAQEANTELNQHIKVLYDSLATLKEEQNRIELAIEDLSLVRIREDIKAMGLPALEEGDTLIEHSAMYMVYSEQHEQAKWVAHIVTPDVLRGSVGRTNDFRADPKISTGSAVEADYFLKYEQDDGSYEYDGFGYDRGHLAPSADFRWSRKALSESYYYSNMSPQVPELNREGWADLEGIIRAYITMYPTTQLYVVTGPVLTDNLLKIERSVNGLSIPERYFKILYDADHQRGIAFLMPNAELSYPTESYAVSINEVEDLTGIDFFVTLDDVQERVIENQKEVSEWMPEKQKNDVAPIYPLDLPKNTFNTIQSKLYVGTGKDITVCGTVVSARTTGKGNVFINLDKNFPNQVFSAIVLKDDLLNFSYDPSKALQGQQLCITGAVNEFGGTPTMMVNDEQKIEPFVPKNK